MDFGAIAQSLITGKVTGGAYRRGLGNDAINIPGTIVGNLARSSNASQTMQNVARYNNYLTWNYGAAQQAADRYMTIKERVPMSFEYYKTPSQKVEVTMYINPDKLSMSTQKVIGKVFTRGGIYYNHYGDDHWTLSLHGTCGWSAMRGIEALEEVYHHSGTLLKYRNVGVSTVHTNAMGQSGGTFGTPFKGSDTPVTNYLNKIIGTAADALGMTGDSGGAIGSLTKSILGNRASQKANANLFETIVGSAGSVMQGVNGTKILNKETARVGNDLANLFTAAKKSKGFTTILKNAFGGTTFEGILKSVAADVGTSIMTGKVGSTETLNALSGGPLGDLISMFNGGSLSAAMSNTATAGNYYALSSLSVSELNTMVSSVQAFNKSKTIDKTEAAANWADIEDLLTDPYRPRQVFIYYDDRVFIGHFNSFTWDRSAAHPLIYFDLKFTVTRQVLLTPHQQYGGDDDGGEQSLKDILITTGVNMIGGLFNSNSGRKASSEATTVAAGSGDANGAPTYYSGGGKSL